MRKEQKQGEEKKWEATWKKKGFSCFDRPTGLNRYYHFLLHFFVET